MSDVYGSFVLFVVTFLFGMFAGSMLTLVTIDAVNSQVIAYLRASTAEDQDEKEEDS